MATIITMIITFVATSIDEMLVLILLFAHARNQKHIRQVYLGQQIGMTFILFIAVISAYGISFFTGKWTGLLGLLPIIIGIMELFGDDEDESEAILHKTSIFSNLTVRVAIIAIAGGAEELAIFVPYFTTLDWNEILVAIVTFMIMVLLWSAISNMLSSMKTVYSLVMRYQRIIIPLIFIGIGLKILLESDTIEAVLDLFL